MGLLMEAVGLLPLGLLGQPHLRAEYGGGDLPGTVRGGLQGQLSAAGQAGHDDARLGGAVQVGEQMAFGEGGQHQLLRIPP